MEQPIRPGAVNWMTAGRGITHSERFERARREGGHLHAIQSWVALPKEAEETEPAFFHHPESHLPVHEGDGVWLRLLAGEAFGLRSPVTTHSPLFYAHVVLRPGARIELPRQHAERAAYLVSGSASAGARTLTPGQMLINEGKAPTLIIAREAAVLMLLGGAPLGTRFIEWNFVSSSQERIEQAKADWRAGRFKLPDADHDEFIPLPKDPPRSAEAMS